jgi:hypothetical protein
VLTAALIAAGLTAGITGAWSPCGFSMVETLAPSGYAGRARTTVAACVTFALGALAGGVITFGGLALLGSALGATAPFAAAVIALAAAVGEAKGARIVPQVRRQVPESWRRVLPVPLAAGLYGVLLGLGFTTFILSFAVWALAGISVALGDPAAGLAIGLAFGAGRALPVVALAPVGGGALHAAMAERPRILRSLRALDAAVLLACAVALFAAPAHAATKKQVAVPYAAGYADPTVDGDRIALHRPGGPGELRTPLGAAALAGTHPAVGGGRTAWTGDGVVIVADLAVLPAPDADAVAVSERWVAWRSGETLVAVPLDPTLGYVPRVVATGRVGRPALAGALLVYDRDGRILSVHLETGARATLRREAGAHLSGPAVHNGRLSYVKATYRRQQLMVGALRPRSPKRDDIVYGIAPSAHRDAGHEPGRFPARGHINKRLWTIAPRGVVYTLTTTALAADAAYVTRVRQQRRGAPATALVLRVALPTGRKKG